MTAIPEVDRLAASTADVEHATSALVRALVLRAGLVGLITVGVIAAVLAAAAGAVQLTAEQHALLLVGLGVGALTGAVGNFIVARGALVPAADAAASTSFLRGLVLDFALQFGAIVGLGLLLYAVGMGFKSAAVFGVALAGASMVFRAPGTIFIARALSARARTSAALAGVGQPATTSETHS